MIRIEDASWIKRRMFHTLWPSPARRNGNPRRQTRDSAAGPAALWAWRDPRIRAAQERAGHVAHSRRYTGGEAIGPDLFDFYRSIGINLKQLYGMTETCVTVCMHPSGDVKLETVGPPMPGVEVRIADSGEVLVRSPGLMKGILQAARRDARGDRPGGLLPHR